MNVQSSVPSWRVDDGLARVSNVPTIATQIAAGLAITEQHVDAVDVLMIGAALAATHFAGMLLNDAFDGRIDPRERSAWSIVAGRIDVHEVFVSGGGLLALGVVLLTLAGARHGHALAAVCAAALLVLAIVAHDAKRKGSGFAPLTMGACHGLVYVCAATSVAGGFSRTTILSALAICIYVAALSQLAKREPDPILARLGLLAPPIALGTAMIARSTGAAALAVCVVAAVVHALHLARAGAYERSTVLLVAGISVLDAALLVGTGHVALGVVAAVTPFATRVLPRVLRGG